jgi:hypothetical protein
MSQLGRTSRRSATTQPTHPRGKPFRPSPNCRLAHPKLFGYLNLGQFACLQQTATLAAAFFHLFVSNSAGISPGGKVT